AHAVQHAQGGAHTLYEAVIDPVEVLGGSLEPFQHDGRVLDGPGEAFDSAHEDVETRCSDHAVHRAAQDSTEAAAVVRLLAVSGRCAALGGGACHGGEDSHRHDASE